MFKHLFKLIWNRKKSNTLLLVEVFLSFLVLFAVLSVFYYNYSFYSDPLGFEYKNVWIANLSPNSDDEDETRTNVENMYNLLNSFTQIESFSFCSDYTHPYAGNTWVNGYKNVEGVYVNTILHSGDDDFAKTAGLNFIEGRWFNKSDDAALVQPIVVNKLFKETFFNESSVAGKKFQRFDDNGKPEADYTVIGVIDNYKYKGEFVEESPKIFRRFNYRDTTANFRRNNSILIKVKAGTSIAFEEKLVGEISRITKGWNVKVSQLEVIRDRYIKDKGIEILVPSSIAFFLILNVALGLMGVLWYSINRRRTEIGLRRAIGASGKRILLQIIGEAIVLGTFAIVIGIAFAVQVPILQLFDTKIGIYIAGILTASVFLYFIITICAFYPSVLAAKVQPVDALHSE